MQLNNSLLAHCDLNDDGETLFVRPHAPSILSSKLVEFSEAEIQSELDKRGLHRAEISRSFGKPYLILAAPPVFPIFSEPGLRAISKLNPILASALDPFAEAAANKQIVTLVSMVTGRCKHSSSELTFERAKRSAPEWTGYDYRQSWKLDGENLSEEYHTLIRRLYDDRLVPGYEYSLIRPDDGAIVRYETDYRLIDFLGEQVRVGISRPEAYTVLEAGRGDRIIR